MADEKTPQQKADALPPSKGKGTLIMEATAAADARNAERRKEEREAAEAARERERVRDAEQDAEKKELVGTALGAVTARAEAAEAANVTKDALNASLHKRYGAIIFFLIVAVVGLAGKEISGNFLKGDINISDKASEKAADEKKKD